MRDDRLYIDHVLDCIRRIDGAQRARSFLGVGNDIADDVGVAHDVEIEPHRQFLLTRACQRSLDSSYFLA